jgi:TolB-like protein
VKTARTVSRGQKRADAPTPRRPVIALRTLFLGVLGVLASVRPATAQQCPDGTPPPCAARPRTAARVTPPPPAERGRRFLVLPFRNLSRTPDLEWLVEGSPTLLSDALGRWQEITVVPDDRLYPALRRHGIVAGTVVEPGRVRRLAEETGGWTAVTGEVLATAGRVRVSARASDVVTGRLLVRATAEVGAAEDVRTAYDRVGAELLRASGLPGETPELASATTRSLGAYRAYVEGVGHYHRAEYRQADIAFREAVRLDSTFAPAYARLIGTALFSSPDLLLVRGSPAYHYAERAAALASRLPPESRDRVRAVYSLVLGQLGASRAILERLVAHDSGDVDGLEALADLEYLDIMLVGEPGHERPRGSLNAAARHSKRVLELDPSRRNRYLVLAQVYALAGGELPGVIPGFRREATSFAEMMSGPMPRIFVPVLRDTFEVVPVESTRTWVPDSVARWRQNARDVARAWIGRWLVASPGESEAYRSLARIEELDGHYDAALRALATAESLGVETRWEAVAARRMVLLGKLGRVAEARRLGDSLVTATYFDSVVPMPSPRLEGPVWAFQLCLLRGNAAGAEALLAALRRAVASVFSADSLTATVFAGGILSGAGFGPSFPILVPEALRLAALDSAFAILPRTAPSGLFPRAVPQLLRLSAQAADAPTRARLASRALDAAFALAAGDPSGIPLARQLAAAAVQADGSLAARAASAPWYAP